MSYLRNKREIRHVVSEKQIVQHLVAFCKQNGIKHIVFSPGSRNAPLVLSFTQDAYFHCKTIVDERSAAFIALGMSLGLQEPVMICCTSGSASLNYAPAIAEAFYQKIPLFVVTADRPQKWINNGEGQAIQQIDVYANYCKASFHCNDFDDTPTVCDTLSQVHASLFYNYKGPVHLNVAFEEPLYNLVSTPTVTTTIPLIAAKTNSRNASDYSDKWNSFEKILIIYGQSIPKKSIIFALQNLMMDARVVVLTESLANANYAKFVNCIDRTLERIPRTEAYQPQLVITIGDAIVSKKIKTFLRATPNLEHWILQENATKIDVFECLTEVIDTEESVFINALSNATFKTDFQEAAYQSLWLTQSYLAADLHQSYLDTIPWSDLKVYDILHQTLPDFCNLHIANSSPIRYLQLFDPLYNCNQYSNRGVSGIDGSTSTALGVAFVSDAMNVLITGDLSFIYDSNAFWNKYPKANLKVIVINNGGGGIFRIIPGPGNSAVMDDYFEVGNTASIYGICQSFDLLYMKAASEVELEQLLPTFYAPTAKATVLEITTPNTVNPIVLNDYFNYIKNN